MYLKRFIHIISFKNLTPLHWGIIFVIFFIIHVPAIQHSNGIVNDYEVLAKSFCHGKFWFSESDLPFVKGTKIYDTGDVVSFQGKYYLPYPPAPSLLVIPFLLITGSGVNCLLIAVLLSCLNIFLIYSILKRLKIDSQYIPWLIYGFVFGSSYWFVILSAHSVYGFAEVVSVTGILLLLNELFGKSRGVLMGIFLSISFLSRQFTIVLGLFVLGYLIHKYLCSTVGRSSRVFWNRFFQFSVPLGCSVIMYCLYNYARFGNPLDTGYSHINFIGVLKVRVGEYGVFSSHYVLYNLYNYLFKGFNIEFGGSGLLHIKGVDLFGTALFVASPFLVASFKTGWYRLVRIFAWLAIGTIFTGLLFYHNNGMEQVNASRFTLDFLPVMLVLTGLGAKNLPLWLFKGMVCYSIMLNIIGIGIHFLYP